MAEELFKKGDVVSVFYRMGKRCKPDRKYFAVLDPRQGAYRPRTGISDGWVPARVTENQDLSKHNGSVRVEYAWPHFFTQRGQMVDNDMPYSEWFPKEGVRKYAGDPASLELISPGSRPTLAILTFRWGGINEIIAPAQWGETGSSVSDIFINSYVDALESYISNDYEVWTIYIEDKSDMAKIADTAHLIFGAQHPLRRAKNVCAMYHLYPTSFEEHCVPTSETGGDGGAALVDQKAFYRMMQAVERAGIPSRFPHDSGFYELLTSKRWTYYMALTPHLNVPPTVALPRMLIEQSCEEAAKWAHKALTEVKQQQQKLRGETVDTSEVEKGVAKLGFSWEALDVKFWKGGVKGLETALYQLTQAIEISDEITGQPHDLENLIIQEYIQHDLEMRLYVVEGEVASVIFTKFCRIKENNEFGDFHETLELEDAAKQWMGNDVAALRDGERQCRELCGHWMDWVRTQCCQTPPGVRFDYFVGRDPKQPGKAKVHTLEICELGFSMLCDKDLPSKVFKAMIKRMLGSGSLPEQRAVKPEASGGYPSDAPLKPGAVPAPQAPVENGNSKDSSVLYVHVPPAPGGTPDQEKCTGKYELVAGTLPNGKPLWINDRGDRFLYFGIDQHWYVGDEEEQDQNFNTDQGYIRLGGKNDLSPDKLRGPWQRGPDWDEDPNILVTTDPEAKPKSSGKGGKKAKKSDDP
eukprot:TRINITY_DN60730_c0_g1_i1.p1 TRINITY_DN60730_c0_g1~~TRINITY_DN60730_c0_g1_i1.p1  ORF type:complete len:710 (+),score=149.41 TRINITY_DN60730_c0_g1_i1:50-2131(+)